MSDSPALRGHPSKLFVEVTTRCNLSCAMCVKQTDGDLPPILIALADATANLCALLVVAMGYGKVLYPRSRNTGIFLVGWWLMVGVYYYLVFLPLEVALLNFADPGHGITYPMIARSLLPEFLGTATITTLIWIALPARYRRPQWIEPKQVPDGKIQDK